MENAAKALTIAGTILISIIVISAFVFMFRDISGVKKQQADNQKTQAIIDFNKSYESYEKELYGAELLSLANKIEDYNERYTKQMAEGYQKITLKVDNNSKASETLTELRDKIEGNKQKSIIGIMEKYKSSNYLEALKEIYDIEENVNSTEKEKEKAKTQKIQIGKKIGELPDRQTIISDYNKYFEYKKLKIEKYRCTGITYYQNGRINTMTFEKIN